MLVCQGDLKGASEKQALGFSTHLAATGHQVLLSLHGDRSTAAAEVDEVPGLTVGWRRYRGPSLAAATLAQAREFAPDLIHAFNPRLAVMQPALQLARATAAPVFVHWEDDEWSIRRGPAGRSLYRRVGRLGRRLLCRAYPPQGVFVTPGMLRWVVEHGRGFDALTPALAEHVQRVLGRECEVVLPVMPSANWEDRRPLDLELPAILAGCQLVLFTGEIHPGSYEDVMLGLRALALVQQRGHPVGFAHAGTMLSRYDLEQMAAEAEMAPGSAISLGYFPFSQLPRVLSSASILVQPGRPIDFNRLRLPSKMQAYLASGTPTITFAAGFAELLEDRVEVLKTYGDEPEELADRIAELLEDSELRATLAAGGPRAARRLFDPVANVETLLAHYRRCLEAGPASRALTASAP